MTDWTSTAVADLVGSGLLATADHVLSATTSSTGADRGRPQRAIDIRALGGVDLRLLPDRGLDISGAWWAGIPLHWTSRVGEVAPREDPSGTAWIESFGGGLLTTCGLRNVGAAAEGHGQHGTFSHLPARDVVITRGLVGDPTITVTARIDDLDALSTHLRCDRAITTHAGEGLVEVTDTVTNLGTRPEPAPMLYHVNFGAPLWSPGATVEIPATVVLPRDDEAAAWVDTSRRAPEPLDGGNERVFEHVLPRGQGVARVVNEVLGIAVSLTWDTAAMPRVHQWVHPAAGVYALGIEPANCSVMGRAHDRAEGRLPVLEPNQVRVSSLAIRVTALP